MTSRILYLFYFLSGFSALIYEVVWLRKLELVFGTTTYAVSTVLAVFFTGLAIGSWVFGRNVDSEKMAKWSDGQMVKNLTTMKQFNNLTIQPLRPLFLYALLELGIGFYAVVTPWIFTGIEQVQAYVWRSFQPSFSGFSIFTFFLSSLGLIIPTILMGGTFPVVVKAASLINAEQTSRLRQLSWLRSKNKNSTVRAQSRTTEQGTGVVGWLYGLNTLGAVLGTLLAGFFLIASIGVNQTIWVAAVISIAVGLVALWLSRILTNEKRI